jgi:hypothetical protein
MDAWNHQLLARTMTNSEFGVPLLPINLIFTTQLDMGGPVLEFDNERVRRYLTRNREPADRFK